MSARVETERDVEILADIPKMYAVIIHNDDFTPMDFVVDVLMGIFHKNQEEANAVMMSVHREGRGVAGVYTFDIAVSKKARAEQTAAESAFPLRFSLSEEKNYEA